MGKTISLLNATKDKNVRHYIPHRLIKESCKNSRQSKVMTETKKHVQTVTKNGLVVTWLAMNRKVLGSNPGGRNVLATKKIQIFCRNFFLAVFRWFFLHKKVSLTTLGPSGRLSGARHGLSQAQGGLQNCLFGQFWPI